MKTLLGRTTSREFREIFTEARDAFGKPIKFLRLQELDTADPFRRHKARMIVDESGARIYIQGSLPAGVSETFAAHELSHLLLDSEGFPKAIWNNRLPPPRVEPSRKLATYIVNVLADPIIAQRLEARGFPALALLSQDVDVGLAILEQSGPVSQRDDQFDLGTFTYMNIRLTLSGEQVERYAGELKKKARWMYLTGEEFVRIALDNGYETAEGNWRAAVDIFDRLPLQHVGLVAPGRQHAPRW